MNRQDKRYYANRAAEEAELAQSSNDPSARAVHRQLQRQYIERASVGERAAEEREPIG